MRRARNNHGSKTESVSTWATKASGSLSRNTGTSSTMRSALGTTSLKKIDSATRERPSRAPVAITSNVLKTRNGARSRNHIASEGLPSAAAIGSAAKTAASAIAAAGIAPASVEKRCNLISIS